MKNTHLVIYSTGELGYEAKDSPQIMRMIEINTKETLKKANEALALLCRLSRSDNNYYIPCKGNFEDLDGNEQLDEIEKLEIAIENYIKNH